LVISGTIFTGYIAQPCGEKTIPNLYKPMHKTDWMTETAKTPTTYCGIIYEQTST